MTFFDPCPDHGRCPGCNGRMCEECGFDATPVDTPDGFKCRDCAAADRLETQQ